MPTPSQRAEHCLAALPVDAPGAVVVDTILSAALDVEELARARRIREDRAHADHYRFGDPSRFIPGQIDNQRKKKRKP